MPKHNRMDMPLDHLVSCLRDWLDVLQQTGLWCRGEGPDDPDQIVPASEEVEQFREPAKAIIVWLEMRGRKGDAYEVDDAMAALQGAARQYDAGELHPMPIDNSDEYATPLDQLIDTASESIGRLEDLDGDIPAEVWQGFDDA